MPADLVTIEQVKAYLGGDLQSNDDAVIGRLIGAAGVFFETACGRPILARDFTELYDGNGGQKLRLRYGPVVAVASLSVDEVSVAPATSIFASGWRLVRDCLVLSGFCFDCGIGNVAVTYTAGFATAPDDVVEALIELVALRYRGRDRIGKTSESLGGMGSASYAQGDVSPFVKSVIARYTRANLL